MIISHKYKFIFIKTLKTAGTSMEIALSKFLDQNDIVTPLHENDEKIRKSLGYITAQNYHLKWPNWNKRDYQYFFRNYNSHYFGGHASAKFIKSHVSSKVWKNYYKFCFDRNPWEKAISLYYWQTRNHKNKPSFENYLKQLKPIRLTNYRKYTINNEVVVDKVYKFENLEKAKCEISKILNFPEILELPITKKISRTNHESIKLNSDQIKYIKNICINEIKLLNY